jgi:hypothetical protein
LSDVNGRSVLRAGHLNQSNRKGCKETKAAESHRKREKVRRDAVSKELDRIGRLFPVRPKEKLSKVRVLLYSKSESL